MKHEDLIQYTDDLLQIAIGRCEDIALAEDLVQETLLLGFIAL